MIKNDFHIHDYIIYEIAKSNKYKLAKLTKN